MLVLVYFYYLVSVSGMLIHFERKCATFKKQ